MTEKQCASCNEINRADANFCSNCGSNEFRDLPTELARRLSERAAAAPNYAVRLSIGRVIIVSILSFGLYFVYWLYLTWKQLEPETRDDHYPVWHTLTLFIPIYGLFRIHRHMSVIKDLSIGVNVVTSVAPGWIVIVVILIGSLDTASTYVVSGVALLLNGISIAMTTTILVSAQSTLNRYWEQVKGVELQTARLGVGEVIFVLLGLLAWVG